MTAKDALIHLLESTRAMVQMLLAELGDADLLVRPCPGANHIAWQLGHLTQSEWNFMKELPGAEPVTLPAGFVDAHKKDAAGKDAGFFDKATYLATFGTVREATIKTLKRFPDADFDKPNPGPMARIAPTYGALFTLVGTHTVMHAGQFSVVRRKLGKPVLF